MLLGHEHGLIDAVRGGNAGNAKGRQTPDDPATRHSQRSGRLGQRLGIDEPCLEEMGRQARLATTCAGGL